MAEINNVIAEASQDLQTIEDFVNLPADSEVYPRLLPSVNVGTLAGARQAIFEAGGLPATPFATKALMTASALVDGDYAQVTDDTGNNGLYIKEDGAWVKSEYDPVEQVRSYVDIELLETTTEISANKSTADNANTGLLLGLQRTVKGLDLTNKQFIGLQDIASNLLQGLNSTDKTIVDLSSKLYELIGNTDANLNHGIHSLTKIINDSLNLSEVGDNGSNKELRDLYITSRLMIELVKLQGFDPAEISFAARDFVDNSYVFGYPKGIIRIDMTMPNIPINKGDEEVEGAVKINIDGQVLDCFAKFGVQGTSSALFPKKNLNLELYSDSDFTKAIALKIGDIQAHSKWIYKAHYIDKSQVRNLTAYRLWAQVQDHRTGYPAKDIDNSYVGKVGLAGVNTQASGHPNGAICVTYINNAYYGLGALMIGKRNENYNMDKSNPDHVCFNFEPWEETPTNRLDMQVLAEETFELRHPKTYTPLVRQHIADFAAVNALPQAEFDIAVRGVLNTQNVVDFYIFTNVLGDWDSTNNNTQALTWDGTHWFYFPYDLDQVAVNGRLTGDMMLLNTTNSAYWAKVLSAYKVEIEARYAYLRKNVYSLDNILELMKKITQMIPIDFYQAELERWQGGDATSKIITSQDEYMQWFKQRLKNVDVLFNYTEVL